MGLLQRWLDEPDESIARHAKQFYVLTYVFIGVFAWQMTELVLDANRGGAKATGFIGPCVALFLALVMYCLALDGRRSYKEIKAAREAAAPRDPKP